MAQEPDSRTGLEHSAEEARTWQPAAGEPQGGQPADDGEGTANRFANILGLKPGDPAYQTMGSLAHTAGGAMLLNIIAGLFPQGGIAGGNMFSAGNGGLVQAFFEKRFGVNPDALFDRMGKPVGPTPAPETTPAPVTPAITAAAPSPSMKS